MNLLAEPRQPQPASPGEFLALVLGYVHLLSAAWDARAAGLSPRDRPLALADLHDRGLDDRTLLWLFYQAHIEQLNSRPPSMPRRHRGHALPANGDMSYVALTEAGEAFAQIFLCGALFPLAPAEFAGTWDLVRTGQLLPRYDVDNRLLAWGRHRLKRFLQPSLNQEIVLRTAEELGWPAWFDDPLPVRRGVKRKVRLHDTIKNLNRHQQPFLVRFQGDGTGSRVGWQLRFGSAPTTSPEIPPSFPGPVVDRAGDRARF